MFPDLFGALDAYGDYYADNTDSDLKKAFMNILNGMWHDSAVKYVGNTGIIKGEARSILEKALRLIHKNKGIHLRLDLDSDGCDISRLRNTMSLTPVLRLQFEVKEGLNKDSVKVLVNENVFTDNWLPEDDKAGISHKIKELDTITYRGVRLAYIIYQAIK